MKFDQILYQVEDGVATITLNQPESLNSFTTSMLNELSEALKNANTDKLVRVIVLTGSGRGFCA